MRICHVIDYFHTDVGYQEYYLALEQARAGHDVHVISSPYRQHTVSVAGPDEQLGAAELAEAGVVLTRLPARQLGHDRAWLRGLAGALSAVKPEVIHIHGPFAPTTVRAVAAASSLGAGVLVDNHVHEEIAPGAARRANRAIYRAYGAVAGPYLRRHVHHSVANGPHEARFLTNRLDLGRDRVEMIPLGFDPDVFGWDPARRQRARANLDADDSTCVVAITGKIHPGKRPQATAAAAELLARKEPVILALAGTLDPASTSAIRSAAPTLSQNGRICELGLLGRQDLSDLYHASDAVVFARLPSISIYEAAGTGTTVLVGADPFAEWLAGQCSGIRSVPTSPLELSAVRPTTDADRTRQAAAAAQFAWPRIAYAFVERYAQHTGDSPDHRDVSW